MAAENLPAVRPVKPESPSQSPPSPHQDKPGGGGEDHGMPTDLHATGGFVVIIAVASFVALLVVLFLVGYIPDHRERTRVKNEAVERASQKPHVQVTKISRQTDASSHDLILPCTLTANQMAAIYTRTSGYLKKWNYDLGQHVEVGKTMAEIETPEVDAQLAQSKASLEQNRAAIIKAEADKDLAQKTLDRYIDSNTKSPGSVTREAIDQNVSALKDADAALNQAQANVKAAEANVQQLATLVGFEKVIAPFSGTVTARNYDVGALLSPTNTASGSEIFDLQQTDLLRVFINVPQEYANYIKPDVHAKLFIRSFPNEAFDGIVALTAGAVDANTRTLKVQVNVDNKEGRLFANEYGEVHLPVKDTETIGLIPTSSLIFNAQATGNQVATVGSDNKIHLKRIVTRRDFGTTIEVASGIDPDDRIVTNPSERVSEGVEVDAKETPNGSPSSQPSAH